MNVETQEQEAIRQRLAKRLDDWVGGQGTGAPIVEIVERLDALNALAHDYFDAGGTLEDLLAYFDASAFPFLRPDRQSALTSEPPIYPP